MPASFLPHSIFNKYGGLSTPSCVKCGLYKRCKSPRMPVTGEGQKEILVIAECPGTLEDDKNIQLIGRAGLQLRESLDKIGIDLDRDCWKTNAVICFPRTNPTPRQVEYCFPTVKKTIEELQPKTVILLGATAVSSVIGWLWKSKPGPMTRWAGWQIPSQQINAWVCPTYHPSYLLRQEKNPNIALDFDKHLKSAFALEGRPWKDVPEYHKDVDIILNTPKAARIIRKMIEKGGMASWDLECTTLKPDSDEAKIVCCSICWQGKKTISFPWRGQAVEAMREFLVSPIKKIAANLKYETRYVGKCLGLRVRNWHFDTMQAAHILDNRRGVSGLKFQAFVKLGQPAYDEYITPFLKSTNSNKANKVKQMPISELLLYCGMDSLLEYKLAEIQMKELGIG